MADINSLPKEVLVRIFHYYLQSDTQLNFINCVSNVCKKWKQVVQNSSFFETVDGSLPLDHIVKLAEAGALQRTKTLKFGKVGNDKNARYKSIYTNMPMLQHLDVTNVCSSFNKVEKHAVFSHLKGLCPELCELVLSHPNPYFHCQTTILFPIFYDVVDFCGPNLVKLNISHVNIVRIEKLLRRIAENCPNLEELITIDIKNDELCIFPVKDMQHGCPKLKILYFGSPFIIMDTSHEAPVGFPKLEKCAYEPYDVHLEFPDLGLLLFNSPYLKILSCRGCRCLNFEAMNSWAAVDLEQIYISWINIEQSRVKLLQKWSHSLNVIDLSHAAGHHINEIFQPLHLPNGLPSLEVLDLSHTSIAKDALAVAIQQSPKLRFLNLEACSYLKQKIKKIYRSRLAIEELLMILEGHKIFCN